MFESVSPLIVSLSLVDVVFGLPRFLLETDLSHHVNKTEPIYKV